VIIVDNSVLVAFVFPQDDFHKAAMAARLKDADWHAPALIRSESRNVARAYLRKGEPLATVQEAVRDASASVRCYTMGDDEVLQVVSDGHLTAYDAEYVALARRLACRVVTQDRDILKFYRAESVSLADFV